MSPSRFNQTGPKIGLSVRLAETQAEIEAAQRLRYQVFAQELGAEIESDDGRDVDPYDEHCHHLLAFDDATGEVIGCYRLITEETAKKVGGWYRRGRVRRFAAGCLSKAQDQIHERRKPALYDWLRQYRNA